MNFGGSTSFSASRGEEKGWSEQAGTGLVTPTWETEWLQSPQANRLMRLLWPAIQNMNRALKRGESVWETPAVETMMPTAETFADIDPRVKEAMMAPYRETEQQLLETLGAQGVLGSARGGFSGQGAAGLGRYWADVAPEYTKSLWGVAQPALARGYEAELAGRQYPYQIFSELLSGAMPSSVFYPTQMATETTGRTDYRTTGKGVGWGSTVYGSGGSGGGGGGSSGGGGSGSGSMTYNF